MFDTLFYSTKITFLFRPFVRLEHFFPTQPCSFWHFQTFLVKIAVFCIEFSNVSILVLKKWLWRLKYLNSTCCIQVWVYIYHEYLSTALQCSLVKFHLKFCYKHFITCDHTHFNFGFCWVISSWAGDTVQSVPKDSRDNEFEPRLIRLIPPQ